MKRQPALPRENLSASPRAALAIELLGGFRVTIGETPVPDSAWRLSKARSLLKLLALASGHRLARDQVLDQLWPDLEPDAAMNNLYQILHGVRRALAAGATDSVELRLRHGLLALQPDGPLQIDVDAFEAAAAQARRSDDPALYHAAITLYTGDLLPDDLYEDWAAGRRESLRDTYLQLMLDLARRHEARGELKGSMEMLRRAVESEPTHEEAHAQLMRLYAATGQRGRALRQYARLREVLDVELDMEPDESSRQLHDAILAGRFGDADAPREYEPHAPIHNLPIALTSFVGREREIAQAREILSTARLLTLTGVGGAGKTRLALRAGWDLLNRYPDGVWLVSLAALASGDLVPGAVAGALQVAERPGQTWTESLVEHVRTRNLLVILDNCEHLRDACAQLSTTLLAVCAELQFVATSRTRLGVPGEASMVVQPLSTPQADDAAIEDLLHCDAVRLFVERAHSRWPSFTLTARNAPSVARICRQVEGIPLAVELASARVGMLSVEQIADRLADAPGLLSFGDAGEARHRTLRAALDWSFDLLTEEEQRLFCRLSVFDGGWLLEGAEALDEGDGSLRVLDLLTELVDKSLVVVEGMAEDVVRYRMLEPVRQYALERLGEAGEDAAMRQRHAALFAALAETAEPELTRLNVRRWLDRLETEHDNLRAALRWSLEQREPEVGLRIAGAIWRFWFAHSHLDEGRATLRRLLDLGGADESVPVLVRGKAFNAAGAAAFFQTDTDEAIERYEGALALYRALGDEERIARVLSNVGLVRKDRGERELAAALLEEALEVQTRIGDAVGMAGTLGNLGILAQESGEYERAQELHEQKLALAREIGASSHVLTALNNLGAIASERGDLARARVLTEEALQLAQELGIKRSRSSAASTLGHVARKQGRLQEAVKRYRESLTIAGEQGDKTAMAASLEGLAATCFAGGQTEDAVILFAAADRLRQSAGTPQPPAQRDEYDPIIGGARQRLGAGFTAAWEAGRSVATDHMVSLAIERSVALAAP